MKTVCALVLLSGLSSCDHWTVVQDLHYYDTKEECEAAKAELSPKLKDGTVLICTDRRVIK